jgi:catechol 2,3-dioxygenase-like lactoylglutathione lyase family enzyme
MTTQGLDHLYVETHNWGKSVAFWESLGFHLDFETDHHSGQLVAPNDTRIFLAEQSPQDPPGLDIYLSVARASTVPPDNVTIVFDWTDTHWGTQVMTVRDPDGRLFRLEAPKEGSNA